MVPGWEGFQIRTLEGVVVPNFTRLPSPLSAGNPAHRGHPGERVRGRGGAAEGGHRHLGVRPVRRGGLRHGFKQRRAWRLFTALSWPVTASQSHTRTHLHTLKRAQADQGYRRRRHCCSMDINRAGRQIKALVFFLFLPFQCKLLHIVP